MGNRGRRSYGRKENGVHAIDDVEQEGRINGVSDGKGHGGNVASVGKFRNKNKNWVKGQTLCILTRFSPTVMTSTAEERYKLITRRLQETLGGDIIQNILAEDRSPKCYWGLSFDR